MKLEALSEASWILGSKPWSAKEVIKRPGLWSKNAPAKYRDMKFTDPRIPQSVHLRVAKKHPKGLQGARSALQSFINLGSAKDKSMDRLKQIAKWVSDEIKKH